MVQLTDGEITTREALGWRGLHLLHWHTSSCSQKTRIVLGLKGVRWTGRLVDLPHRLYPVMAGGDLVGVISRRDIVAALTDNWQWSS